MMRKMMKKASKGKNMDRMMQNMAQQIGGNNSLPPM